MRLENFLLLNACMDAALLCVALRWCARPLRIWRIALASLLGAVYAAAACLPRLASLRSLPVALIASALMLCVAARWHRWLHLLRAVALLCAVTFLMGGTVFALAQALGGLPLIAPLGAVLAVALGAAARRGMRRARQVRLAQIRLRYGDADAEVEGLVDTGNLLTEPFSGLPVVIVPQALLRSLLPEGCDPTRLETLPPGFRLVCAATTGGTRMLMCFRPSSMEVRCQGVWQPVRAMVAIGLHAMPEGALALIPAALVAA